MEIRFQSPTSSKLPPAYSSLERGMRRASLLARWLSRGGLGLIALGLAIITARHGLPLLWALGIFVVLGPVLYLVMRFAFFTLTVRGTVKRAIAERTAAGTAHEDPFSVTVRIEEDGLAYGISPHLVIRPWKQVSRIDPLGKGLLLDLEGERLAIPEEAFPDASARDAFLEKARAHRDRLV